MHLIGARLIVLCPSASYGLQWKSGYLRAASEPVLELVHLLRPDIQVRWSEGSEGEGVREFHRAWVGDILLLYGKYSHSVFSPFTMTASKSRLCVCVCTCTRTPNAACCIKLFHSEMPDCPER